MERLSPASSVSLSFSALAAPGYSNDSRRTCSVNFMALSAVDSLTDWISWVAALPQILMLSAQLFLICVVMIPFEAVPPPKHH